MLPTNLIQLDNPPEIKFCAFYKVCHKTLKKLLNIEKFVLIADQIDNISDSVYFLFSFQVVVLKIAEKSWI